MTHDRMENQQKIDMSFWKLILIIQSRGAKNFIQEMLGNGDFYTFNKLVSKQGFFGMHEPLL